VVPVGDLDDLPEPDGVPKTQRLQIREELLVPEAAVREQRHVERFGQNLMHALDDLRLVVASVILQPGLLHGLPHQRRCPAVRGHEVHGDRGMVGGVELGKGEGEHHILPRGNDEPHPVAKPVPHVDPSIAKQAVDLLFRVLWRKAHRVGQPTTDDMDAEGRRMQNAHNPTSKRQYPGRVHVISQQIGNEVMHLGRRYSRCRIAARIVSR
jgi:hypothetical protein